MAWDVQRLIVLSKDFPTFAVSLDEIAEVKENHWYAYHDVPTCESIVEHCKLIEAADLAYPIILDQSGRVMDGMHRVCKALMLGQEVIYCVQFDQDPEPDYVDCDPDSLPYVEYAL